MINLIILLVLELIYEKVNFVYVRADKRNIFFPYFLMFPSVGLDYDTCSRQNILLSNIQMNTRKKRVECFFFKCVYFAALFSSQKIFVILVNHFGKIQHLELLYIETKTCIYWYNSSYVKIHAISTEFFIHRQIKVK